MRNRIMTGQVDSVPWYRASGYDGNLTEAEKQKLDAFRAQERHPAAIYSELPEEVQQYIAGLSLEAYDLRETIIFWPALFVSVLGLLDLTLNYFGYRATDDILQYAIGALMLVAPWVVYKRKLDGNRASILNPDANECFRREWELIYVANMKGRGISD